EELAFDDLGAKHVKAAQRLGRILDLTLETLERAQFSGVTDLAAALAVEWSLVRDDVDDVADFRALDALAVLDHRKDDALAFVAGIAGELGASELLGDIEPKLVGGSFARALPGGSS